MDCIENIFCRKKLFFSRLEPYAFGRGGEEFIYCSTMKESGFEMKVKITPKGNILAEGTDQELGEAYTLHLADGTTGAQAGTGF